MAGKKATYSEEDVRQAFLCGIRHGSGKKELPAGLEGNGWLDALFYEGFNNDDIFRRPGFSMGNGRKKSIAKAGQ